VHFGVFGAPDTVNHTMASRRPLPSPPEHLAPMGPRPYQYPPPRSADLYAHNSPYFMPYPYPQYAPPAPDLYEEPEPATSSFPVGTFLHKGFYDLLSMIPTPSPSRLLWKDLPPPPDPVVAGPRYEEIGANNGIKASPKKGRRVSKDMVSKPTGFVYVVYVAPVCLFIQCY